MAATDFDFILTRNELLESAFRTVGALADGESLSAEQLAIGVALLNSILNSWGEDDVMLWAHVIDTVTTSVGQSHVTIPTDEGIAYVDKVFYRDAQNSDDEIDRKTWAEYQQIANKTDSGRPIVFAQSAPEGRIYLYPVPDEARTLLIHGIARLKDWDAASSTGNLPSRWQLALKFAVSAQLANEYTLPIREREWLAAQAEDKYLRARMKEKDIPRNSGIKGCY